MVVGEEHQGLNQLRQRPTVLPRFQQSLQTTWGWKDTPPQPPCSLRCTPPLHPRARVSQGQGNRRVFGMCLPHKPAAVTAGQSPAVGGQVTPSPTLPHPSGAAQTLPSESDTPSALKGLNLGDGGLEQARMGFLRSSPPNRVWFGGGGSAPAASALTSMCSLVMSQGRCASSLLISLRFLSFWGA